MTDEEAKNQKGKATSPRSRGNKGPVLDPPRKKSTPTPAMSSQVCNCTHCSRTGPDWGYHGNLGHTYREREKVESWEAGKEPRSKEDLGLDSVTPTVRGKFISRVHPFNR